MIDVEKLAREAGLTYEAADPSGGSYNESYVNDEKSRAKFAALVLEKAAEVCEGMHPEDGPHAYAYVVRQLAQELRA